MQISREKKLSHPTISHSFEDLDDVKNDSVEISKQFTLSENDAQKSIELAHTTKLDDGSYKCDYCSLTCRQRYKMKNHIMTHTGEKPYPCYFCELSFSLKRNLK